MSTKHTPGPWSVLYSTGDNKPSIHADKLYMEPIATLYETFFDGASAQHIDAEANARLIAAAPEMFELMQSLSMHHPSSNKALNELAVKACRLIAKVVLGDDTGGDK